MKVLAIDGGGIRGLIPALVLAEIGKPDPLPATEIASIYEEEGPKIFDRSLLKQITSLGGYLDERCSDTGAGSSGPAR